MKTRVLNSAKREIYEPLKILSRAMRNQPTEAESILWSKLKRKQLGSNFRRQHIIDRFIVDFYSLEKNLVIEVDGEIHDSQKERDKAREQLLMQLGCKIMRFTNNEVFYELDDVVRTIQEQLKEK